MKTLWLAALGILLVALPLESSAFHGTFWLLTLVLCLFYVYVISGGDVRLRRNVIELSVVLTALLGFVTWLRVVPALDWFAVAELLAVIWLIPFGRYLIDTFGVRLVVMLVVGVMVIQAQWGIGQFMFQQDAGLQLVGETHLALDEVGVAKFMSSSGKLLRAYGPYPHANSFGGSLALGVVGLGILMRLSRGRLPTSFLYPVAFVLLLGILTSFSRLAYFALVLAIPLYVQHRGHVSRKLALISLLTLIVFTPLLIARSSDPDDAAVVERAAGYRWAQNLISETPLWRAVGPGNYETALRVHLQERVISHEAWQVTPVHSVPLLLLVEWGVVAGLAVIGIGVWQMRNVPWMVWFPIVPLVLFDHYLLTQVGPMAILLVVVIAAKVGLGQEEMKAT